MTKSNDTVISLDPQNSDKNLDKDKDFPYTAHYSESHHNSQQLSGKDFKDSHKIKIAPKKQRQKQLEDLGYLEQRWVLIKQKSTIPYVYDYWTGDLHQLYYKGKKIKGRDGKTVADTREKWEDKTLVYYWGECWRGDKGEAQIDLLAKEGSLFLITNHLNIKEGEPLSIGMNNVKAYPAIFAEVDNLSIDEQWDKIAEISCQLGLKVSIVVFSGGKSLHIYFIFQEPITDTETWLRLQRKLICLLKSDPTVSNPNREMRLAGVERIDKGKDQSLQAVTEARYTPEELEEKLDSTGKFLYGMDDNRFKQYRSKDGGEKALSDPNIGGCKARSTSSRSKSSNTSSNTLSKASKKPLSPTCYPELTEKDDDEIPHLYEFLTKKQKKIVDEGLKDGRKNEGYGLAANLVATARRLVELGIKFKGDAREIYLDFCHRCSQAREWNENEWDKHWDSAYERTDDPCFSDGKLRLKVYNFRRDARNKTPLTKKEWKAELSKFSVDKVIHERYFDISHFEEIIGVYNLLLIKGFQGVGKSFTINEIIQKFLDDGKAVFMGSHRSLLSEMIARKAGIPFQDDEGAYKSKKGYAFVINSLWKIDIDDPRLEGACLVLDEIDQVMDVMFNDSTMKSHRLKSIEHFCQVVGKIVSTGGLVIGASADIADYIKDFLQKICQEQLGYVPPTYCLENTFDPVKHLAKEIKENPEDYELTYFNDGKDGHPTRLFQLIYQKLEQGEKAIIHTTSQIEDSPFSSLNLEAYLQRKYPHLKTLRYDSQTNKDPNHPAYQLAKKLHDNPAYLDQFDVVVMSPVAETGISIDDPNRHFDFVAGIFNSGNQDGRAVLQTLLRLRRGVPRFIWVNKHSHSKIGSGVLAPPRLVRDMDDHSQKLLKVLRNLQIVEDASELKFNDNQVFFKAWSYSACLKNNDFKDYRDSILEVLKERGFPITEMDGKSLKEMDLTDYDLVQEYRGIKKNKEASVEKFCKKVVDTPEPDEERKEQLKNAKKLTPEEQLEKYKGFICSVFCVPPTIEVVARARHDRTWIQALKLRYYMTIGKEHLPERERKLYLSLTRETGESFAPESVKKHYALKIYAMEKYGIPPFLEKLGEKDCPKFTDEQIEEWAEMVRENQKEVKQLLGVSTVRKPTKKEIKDGEERKFVPVKSTVLLNKFLALLDLSLDGNQITINQERETVYKISQASKPKYEELIWFTDEVLETWLRKDNEKKNYWAEFPQAIDITKEFLKERGTIGEQILRDKIDFFNNPEISIEAKKIEVKEMEEERQELIKREIEKTIIYEGEEVVMLEEGGCPRGLLTLDIAPFVSNLSDYGYVPDSEAVPAPKSEGYPRICSRGKELPISDGDKVYDLESKRFGKYVDAHELESKQFGNYVDGHDDEVIFPIDTPCRAQTIDLSNLIRAEWDEKGKQEYLNPSPPEVKRKLEFDLNPQSELQPELDSEPKPEPKPESKSEPKSEPQPEPKSEPKPEPKPETKPEPKSEPQPEPQPKPQPHPDSKPQLQPEPEPEPQISLRPYTPPQEKWAVDEETFKMFEKRHEKDPLIDKDCVEKVRFAQDKEEDDPKIWWDILEIGKSNIQLKNRVTGETCRVLSYPCSFVSKDDIALYKVGDGVALNNENPQYFEVIEVDSDANQLVLSSTEDVKIFVTPRECLKVTWDAPS